MERLAAATPCALTHCFLSESQHMLLKIIMFQGNGTKAQPWSSMKAIKAPPGHECIKSIKEVNHLKVSVHRDCNERTCQLSCWGEQYIRVPALVACLSSDRVVNSSPIGVPVNKKLPFFCHGAQQLLVLLSIDFWLAASSSCQICSPPSILLYTFLHCGFCVRDNWASLQPANQVKISSWSECASINRQRTGSRQHVNKLWLIHYSSKNKALSLRKKVMKVISPGRQSSIHVHLPLHAWKVESFLNY